MIRRIAAISFIFFCTTIAWMILASTLSSRTNSSNEHLEGRVASTWGTAQEQSPPAACYRRTELSAVTEQENENEEQFSIERLKNLILSKETDSAATLVSDVTEAVSTFAGTKEQEDDLTLVVAKIL